MYHIEQPNPFPGVFGTVLLAVLSHSSPPRKTRPDSGADGFDLYVTCLK